MHFHTQFPTSCLQAYWCNLYRIDRKLGDPLCYQIQLFFTPNFPLPVFQYFNDKMNEIDIERRRNNHKTSGKRNLTSRGSLKHTQFPHFRFSGIYIFGLWRVIVTTNFTLGGTNILGRQRNHQRADKRGINQRFLTFFEILHQKPSFENTLSSVYDSQFEDFLFIIMICYDTITECNRT